MIRFIHLVFVRIIEKKILQECSLSHGILQSRVAERAIRCQNYSHTEKPRQLSRTLDILLHYPFHFHSHDHYHFRSAEGVCLSMCLCGEGKGREGKEGRGGEGYMRIFGIAIVPCDNNSFFMKFILSLAAPLFLPVYLLDRVSLLLLSLLLSLFLFLWLWLTTSATTSCNHLIITFNWVVTNEDISTKNESSRARTQRLLLCHLSSTVTLNTAFIQPFLTSVDCLWYPLCKGSQLYQFVGSRLDCVILRYSLFLNDPRIALCGVLCGVSCGVLCGE